MSLSPAVRKTIFDCAIATIKDGHYRTENSKHEWNVTVGGETVKFIYNFSNHDHTTVTCVFRSWEVSIATERDVQGSWRDLCETGYVKRNYVGTIIRGNANDIENDCVLLKLSLMHENSGS